jgi:hypothetical protein
VLTTGVQLLKLVKVDVCVPYTVDLRVLEGRRRLDSRDRHTREFNERKTEKDRERERER